MADTREDRTRAQSHPSVGPKHKNDAILTFLSDRNSAVLLESLKESMGQERQWGPSRLLAAGGAADAKARACAVGIPPAEQFD